MNSLYLPVDDVHHEQHGYANDEGEHEGEGDEIGGRRFMLVQHGALFMGAEGTGIDDHCHD